MGLRCARKRGCIGWRLHRHLLEALRTPAAANQPQVAGMAQDSTKDTAQDDAAARLLELVPPRLSPSASSAVHCRDWPRRWSVRAVARRSSKTPPPALYWDFLTQNVMVQGLRVTGVIDRAECGDRGPCHFDAATTVVILLTSAMEHPRWMRDNVAGNNLRRTVQCALPGDAPRRGAVDAVAASPSHHQGLCGGTFYALDARDDGGVRGSRSVRAQTGNAIDQVHAVGAAPVRRLLKSQDWERGSNPVGCDYPVGEGWPANRWPTVAEAFILEYGA